MSVERVVYFYDFCIGVLSRSLNVGSHSHLAHQVTIALGSGDLALNCEYTQGFGRAFYISPMSVHSFSSGDCLNFTLLIDDEAVIDDDCSQRISNLKFGDILNDVDCDLSLSPLVIRKLINRCDVLVRGELEPRIKSATSFIKSYSELSEIKASEVAESVGLSEGRFLHLFKEEVGVPFRKYVLWRKLARAGLAFGNGANLAEIAQIGGFSDSAHMSKYFKLTFGINPVEVLQNSQFIHE